MTTIQRSKAHIILLACSLMGVGIAIYLTAVHYENVPLVCSGQGLVNCSYVLSSAYSVVPGTSVPISVPGLAWCLVSGALAIAGLYLGTARRWIPLAQFAWSLLGMLTVLYLVYVEIVRLHTICAWCSALHALILLTFLVAIVQLRMQPSSSTEELDAEDEEEVVSTPSRSK